MKILVTGGVGYIGSHTIVELQNNNFDIVIIDNLCNSKIEVLDNIAKITNKKPAFENIDIRDKEKLEDLFKKNDDIGAVIHFAALKSVSESIQKPLEYYKNNVCGMINLLEILQKYNISNFVFSSSATVYGESNIPVLENSPIQKANCPYGSTKIICEQILEDFTKINKNFKTIILRYFNPIGAHESGLIGELPNGIPANLVPFITQTAIGKIDGLKIFGNDYNTKDGTCIRDYIHVVDLAKAHIKSIERLIDNKNKNNYEIFNIGTGHGTSVLEIINKFKSATGIKLNYKIADRRPGDIEFSCANVDLANNELNWKAEKTIEEALLSAWKWEQNLLIEQ